MEKFPIIYRGDLVTLVTKSPWGGGVCNGICILIGQQGGAWGLGGTDAGDG